MKRNIRRKIGQFLTSKVSPLAMFVGCLFVCIVIAGSVAVANNDNITVNSGGVLNISNQQASDNLGYSVAITNDSGVDATFANDVDVVGDLTAGTITSDAAIAALGALSAGTTVTAGTNVVASNGYFYSTKVNSVSTTYETIGNVLYANCTGSDVDGCDDGVYNVIRFMADAQGGDRFASEATTTGEIRMYMDDSASSSMEVSMEFWARADDTSVLTKVGEFDSGVFNLVGAFTGTSGTFSTTLGVTGSSTMTDLAVSDKLTALRITTTGSSTLDSIQSKYFSEDGSAGLTGSYASTTFDNLIFKNGLLISNTTT